MLKGDLVAYETRLINLHKRLDVLAERLDRHNKKVPPPAFPEAQDGGSWFAGH